MVNPALDRLSGTSYEFAGPLANYLEGVNKQWLHIAPVANPAMLEMFRDRERQPQRDLVPWAGEFAGKYLTSAVQIWRMGGDATLAAHLQDFVAELVSLQAEDGYLGPWPRRYRLTGMAPNVSAQKGPTWDAWGHYHIMLGLLLWYEDTQDAKALRCVRGIADLLCRKFLGNKSVRLVDTGSSEMNLAVVHSLCLLYRYEQEHRYLALALQLVDEFAAVGSDGPLAGDYLHAALAGTEFYCMPKPRWESLHPIMAMAELYWLTGKVQYRQAYEWIWWSIVKLDRHNNGGFSSGEQAQGNPYHKGAIETCCTVAWMAASIEMLRLTGNSIVADELELSTLNSTLGLHSHTGRWVTYNTPMDGVRRASAHDIVFQAREGSSELNCCSVNGPRGLGMVGDWALMGCEGGLVLNWYGPCDLAAALPSGNMVRLQQQTEYPRKGQIDIMLELKKSEKFVLKLRLPYWSARTRVKLNGVVVKVGKPGTYLVLQRTWNSADTIRIELDMRPHFWKGERECRGRVSIYRGPILLTYDRRLNAIDPEQIPALDAQKLKLRLLPNIRRPETIALVECKAENGDRLRLCDFASAGEGGTPYVSWFKVNEVAHTPFSKENPLRSGRS